MVTLIIHLELEDEWESEIYREALTSASDYIQENRAVCVEPVFKEKERDWDAFASYCRTGRFPE